MIRADDGEDDGGRREGRWKMVDGGDRARGNADDGEEDVANRILRRARRGHPTETDSTWSPGKKCFLAKRTQICCRLFFDK